MYLSDLSDLLCSFSLSLASFTTHTHAHLCIKYESEKKEISFDMHVASLSIERYRHKESVYLGIDLVFKRQETIEMFCQTRVALNEEEAEEGKGEG